MKIALIISICLVICLIGYQISHQFVSKYKFYMQLRNLLEDIKLNISFKKEKLKSIINKYDNRELRQFIKAFNNYLDTNDLSLDCIREIDQDDVETIKEIITSIGNYNSSTELMQISTFIDKIKTKELQAEIDKKKFTPMIIKLSVLLSIAVGIILL